MVRRPWLPVEMAQRNLKPSSQDLVILIHGTFARKATWTKEGSPLFDALRERLGDACNIEHLPWSGANMLSARVNTLGRLQDRIAQHRMAHPDSQVFVVAHSHAGNLGYWAFRGDAEERKPDGLVTLATPFVVMQENETASLSLFAFWGCMMVLSFVFFYWASLDLTEPHRNVFQFLVIMMFVIGIGWWSLRTRGKPPDIGLPYVPPDKVLILRSLADEATGVLQMAAILQFLFLFPVSLLERFRDWAGRLFFGRKRGAVVAILLTAIASFVAVMREQSDAAIWGTLYVYSSTVFMAFIAICICVPIVGAALIVPFRAILLLAYGWDMPFRAFSFRVSAEVTPPGDWTISTFAPFVPPMTHRPTRADARPKAMNLAHSEIYDHPDAISKISDWIVARQR